MHVLAEGDAVAAREAVIAAFNDDRSEAILELVDARVRLGDGPPAQQ
jgi:hypothetical protein